MALLTVRPSRGTIAFFALIVVGLCIRFAWGKHELAVVARDAPPAHDTRRVLRCVLGPTAERLMGPRPNADPHGETWARAMHARLQRLVTSHHGEGWPARCAPMTQRLAARLSTRPETMRAARYAYALARSLAISADRLTAIEQIERGDLSAHLANLAFEVSGLSDGASEGWTSPVPLAPTDLSPVRLATVPRGAFVAHDAVEYAMFATPDLVLYQQPVDRSLHAVAFGDDERAGADRVVGPGAPVRGAARGGPVLVASDEGDSIFLPGGEPAALVPLPDAVRAGREPTDDWQVAFTPSYLWLLTRAEGALRVRTTPRAGPSSGPVRWSEPLATLGGGDQIAGAVLAPEADGSDAVRVTAVRRGGSGVWVEQYGLVATPAPAPAPVAAAVPTATASDEPAALEVVPAPTVRVVPGAIVVPEWAAFDPRVVTCAAGATRYLLVRTVDAFWSVRIEGQQATRHELLYERSGAPAGGRFELTCDEHDALVYADLVGRPGSLLYFHHEREAAVLTPPRFTQTARVVGGALGGDGTIVALVADGAMRSYSTGDGARWSGGELVSIPDDGNYFHVAGLAALDGHVAVLGEMPVAHRVVVGRLGSRDATRAFRGE